MKKMLSLAALLAVVAYATPASAELKFGGDAGIRMRTQFDDSDTGTTADDVKWQYRIRLKGAADLGSGYFFKTMLMNEDGNIAGGWQSVGYGNHETIGVDISNFYFGRMMQDSHYMMGRMPLNSFNNPILDLSLYPMQALDTPVFNINFDRGYGVNYGTKLGDGDLNATVLVLDNESPITAITGSVNTDGGLFNDGYGVHLSYKMNIGDITIEPQMVTVIGNTDIWDQTKVATAFATNAARGYVPATDDVTFAKDVTPWTFGATASVPVGDELKLTGSAFYTFCEDNGADYHAAVYRLKGEYGPFMAWVDYNPAADNKTNTDYSNTFVWAQYKYNIYESAAGSFNLQPTLRWLTKSTETASSDTDDTSTLRAELWATVSF
ncbi:hypothetical protein EKD00_07135 [Chlorobium phaeovibrioides]|uniref:hypothetical protein n=1 Tax=Chlorobium phaeovibrioides TaxID=1094 RepID=UPI000F8359C3|nr:hypothetical protein [Chlorobium phaeovibrioides]RTY34839.1 hypothetical protein EKD00_07135 [Chlorobium phaeovibrioides]